MVLYGIPNCDTVKKARRWLAEQQLDYEFHDYKKAGIERDDLAAWCERLGWQALLNTRGTTWRRLDEALRRDIDEARAIELMLAHTSLIKRPVIEHEDQLLVGFDPVQWTDSLKV